MICNPECLLPRRQNPVVETNGVGVLLVSEGTLQVCQKLTEHSLLMHQCTTKVLCNLAGLILRTGFHPSSFHFKPIRLAFSAKQVFFYVSF